MYLSWGKGLSLTYTYTCAKNMKSFNLIGIIAVVLAVAGAVINIGHFFESKYVGWAFIWAGLALAVLSMWMNIRKHKR
ncbi:hypothetical protein H9Q13_05825 [Pontibacter sp. JH31]|uniref:Uncharacterized protein n=1 Tax=Pontibacter aquaedesilientis TaxID=2766980 RepID=A0ABR7XEF4_9BACT|nr:hypothetical protein [Pontibacter aquaedesilientis]MBD1396678.1 hypothetical protein [Pontibacter aquaedesilientis]